MVLGHKEYIAYFSMEIGISHTIPSYAGGLGILAGDLLKSFADLRLPVIGITLLNSKGYFTQVLDDDGNQSEKPVEWNIADYMTLMPNIVSVNIDGRDVKIMVWRHMIRGINDYNIPVFFLDSNVDGNSDFDKTLTSYLYGGDKYYRLAQEIILGIGGVRMLESLGYDGIKKYHMNEGHSALLTVELLRKSHNYNCGDDDRCYDLPAVRDKCVFTTHTPIAAGHDTFDIALFRQLLHDYVPQFIMDKAVHDGKVNMTLLALNASTYINGVAKRHGEITRDMFPGYIIDAITNGIHPQTWVSPQFKVLFDKYMPGWVKDPFTLRYALSIPREELLDAHMEAKKVFIDEVNKKTGMNFHPLRFTIGYARRFTEYKRPALILHDIAWLRRIAEHVGDIQIIFAGKAHAHDYRGKEIIREVIHAARQINNENCRVRIAFIEGYDMLLARRMVAGCDIWLNNPQRPFEASGTSGMKAALNGVPQASTLDGWWLEGCIENVTGWSIGAHPSDPGFNIDVDMVDEAKDLYEKLEYLIIPTFYGNKEKWADIMRHAVAINASFFNTYRMAQQYMANAYMN